MGQPVERRSGVGDFFAGIGYLARGLRWIAAHPKLWAFGLIPALIVLAVYGTALALLGFYGGDLAEWLTPFADDWSDGPRRTLRVIAGLALFGGAAFLALVTFTAVTLLVGDPFYENIAVKVEESQGGAPPEPDEPLLVQLARSAKDSAVVAVFALAFAIVFFVLGLLPVVGQTVVPVAAVCVSGFFLAGELTSVALQRRGLRRRDRFALLKRHRPLAVGFGAATVVLFLIPLGAVLAMPGAVAGGTLLARERLVPGIRAADAVVKPVSGV